MNKKEVIDIIDKRLNKIYKGCRRWDGKRKQIGLLTDENNKLKNQYCGDPKAYLIFNKEGKIKNNRGIPITRGAKGFPWRKVILCVKCSHEAKLLEEIKLEIEEYGKRI